MHDFWERIGKGLALRKDQTFRTREKNSRLRQSFRTHSANPWPRYSSRFQESTQMILTGYEERFCCGPTGVFIWVNYFCPRQKRVAECPWASQLCSSVDAAGDHTAGLGWNPIRKYPPRSVNEDSSKNFFWINAAWPPEQILVTFGLQNILTIHPLFVSRGLG